MQWAINIDPKIVTQTAHNINQTVITVRVVSKSLYVLHFSTKYTERVVICRPQNVRIKSLAATATQMLSEAIWIMELVAWPKTTAMTYFRACT